LTLLGLIHTQTIGRAGVHTVNEHHVAVAALRRLLDPITMLTDVVRDSVGDEIGAVILFGSIARGEATTTSDVDLAVIGPVGWDGRTELEDAVRLRLGNDCDVLVFTREDFDRVPGEPVVRNIRSEGVTLLGSVPLVRTGVA